MLRATRKGAVRRYLSECPDEKYETHGEQAACDAIFGHYHFEEMAKEKVIA